MTDKILYDILSEGLWKAEAGMKRIGIGHWKVALLAYDPDNPRAYMVIGSAGEEVVQSQLAAVINPGDADRPHDYVAEPRAGEEWWVVDRSRGIPLKKRGPYKRRETAEAVRSEMRFNTLYEDADLHVEPPPGSEPRNAEEETIGFIEALIRSLDEDM